MNENQVHAAIVANVRFLGCPGVRQVLINNNPRSARDGVRLRAQGMERGVPDMVYALPNGKTVWHEIKTEKGRPSPEQKQYHEFLKSIGHVVIVTYGLGDALRQLKERGILK